MMSAVGEGLKEYVETTFGSDVKNLHNIEELFKKALEKRLYLEKQLSVITTEVPTKIENALSSAKNALEKAEELEIAKDSINISISKCVDKSATSVENLKQSVNKVVEIEQYISYMKWIVKIEETSDDIQQSILSDGMNDACSAFQQFVTYYIDMLKHSSKCSNLLSYLKKTIVFWYNILKEKLCKDLDVVLKQIGWPFVSSQGPQVLVKSSSSSDKVTPSPYNVPDPASNFERIIVNLLNIQLPSQLCNEESDCNGSNGESQLINTDDDKQDLNGTESVTANNVRCETELILLPFQLLLKPLYKRFRYHFSGNKQTNVVQKPEWYLTQILNWISYHSGFMEQTIQVILDDHKYEHVDALVMFTQGLLQLVTDKLSSNIDEIASSDELFSHTVDEILLFDRELRNTYNIPDSLLKKHGPLTILAQPYCMRKWLNIERICAVERLDALFAADQAWQSEFSNSDNDENDEMKTPQCAEAFITMLLTITDRYKSLPCYKQQLQFLDLQLLLLDDFRIRLTQVMRSVASGQFDDISIAILNASHYITIVLREWADNVFFLQLKYYRDKMNTSPASSPILPKSFLNLGDNEKNQALSARDNSTDETVFDSIVTLYDRIYQEGVENIAQAIFAEFKAKSKPYINDQWLTLPSAEDQVSLVISRSACPMLEVIQERLHSSEQKLGRALFTKLWRLVAESVDKYLYDGVVIGNHFNVGGALQLQFDMTRNLFPLFGTYTNKPENYFKRMKEACILLNLPVGTALLMKEAIQHSAQTRGSNITSVITDVGITLLKFYDVDYILRRRVDWTQS